MSAFSGTLSVLADLPRAMRRALCSKSYPESGLGPQGSTSAESAMAISLRKPESYFTDVLQVRCPPVLPPAIERAAAQNLMTASEYVRRSVIDRLKADGVKLRPASEEAA
jgi:hypothetical protein